MRTVAGPRRGAKHVDRDAGGGPGRARPLVTPKLVDRVAKAARKHGAAVPVAAVPESMRRVVDGRITDIIDRIDLYRSQTPHGTRRELLLDVYARQDPHGPDTFID